MADHMDMDDSDSGVVDQPNADRMDIEQPPSPSPWLNLNQLTVPSFYSIYRQCRATELSEAWPLVESSFKEFGILCTLNLEELKVTVSTPTKTMDPDIIHKAIELALNGRENDPTKFGTQEGELGSKYRMKKILCAGQQEECDILRKRLSHSLKTLEKVEFDVSSHTSSFGTDASTELSRITRTSPHQHSTPSGEII